MRGKTPLQATSDKGHTEIVSMLQDKIGSTPLHYNYKQTGGINWKRLEGIDIERFDRILETGGIRGGMRTGFEGRFPCYLRETTRRARTLFERS